MEIPSLIQRILLASMLLLLISACQTSQEEKQISLVNGIRFAQAEKESLLPTADSSVTQPYEQFFNQRADLQIPLFKFVNHPQYKLYIGLPFGMDLERLSAKMQTAAALRRSSNENSFYQIQWVENTYLIDYGRQFEKENTLIYIAIQTQDSSQLAHLSAEALNRRLIKK